MSKVDVARLIRAALAARKRAVAPYSKFLVGAALQTARGKLICGANVESASYGLTCCAERVVLFKALVEGEREFVALAVVARTAGGPTPCGACRQLLSEYAPSARVYLADSARPSRIRAFAVGELLPYAFTLLPPGAA
jgi:cytidine deaminase